MSQRDDDDLKVQLQKTETARAKAAREWQRHDSVLYSDLPQAKKLGLLSHLRRANSETGEQWASAAIHAKAMSVGPKQAERVMRSLREDDKVLELVKEGDGGTNTVKITQSWMAEVERHYLEWKTKGPRTLKAGVAKSKGGTPDAGMPPTPDAQGRGPRTPACPYPLSDPATLSGDGEQPTVALTTPGPQVASADTSDSKTMDSGAELHVQELGVVEADEGIPWVEPKNLPAGYAQGVWFNRRLGKLYLVQGKLGMAFYRGLRDDGYSPSVIRAGLTAAGGKAANATQGAKARGGALEGLVRQYVGYALEDEKRAVARSQARETAFQRPRMFQP